MNRVGLVILDGVGYSPRVMGNAVRLAKMKNFNKLIKENSCLIKAHGTSVGLPSNSMQGNSEVGHNAIGAGKVIEQGLSLINKEFKSGKIFKSETWKNFIENGKKSAVHFIGLLSDSELHGNITHLKKLVTQCNKEGIENIYIHALLDGRDVEPHSGVKYYQNVVKFLEKFNKNYKIVDFGGRSQIVMDRYEANIDWVKKGYNLYINREGNLTNNPVKTIKEFYETNPTLTDQDIPPYIITKAGKIKNGDSVMLYNYRGDRAIEFSQLFDNFKYVSEASKKINKCYFVGMMQYDEVLKIPKNYLVGAPDIDFTLTHYLIENNIKQFSISESQKFGHVTYYFNGNRKDKISEELEIWKEIESDKNIQFNLKPKMKAKEIAKEFCNALSNNDYKFLKVNLTNGDMVGHTGDLKATITALKAVDKALGQIIKEAKRRNVVLLVTADHGNTETMIDENGKPVTSHTCNPVHFCVVNNKNTKFKIKKGQFDLTNIANSVIKAMGKKPIKQFNESIIK